MAGSFGGQPFFISICPEANSAARPFPYLLDNALSEIGTLMPDITPSILADRAIEVARPQASDYADDVRVVYDDQELSDALRDLTAGSGGIIELSSDHVFSLSAKDYQNQFIDAPVLIRSADPDNPATISAISLTDRENISIQDVEFYGTRESLGEHTKLINVERSENIAFYDSTIHSDATGAAGLSEVEGADMTVGSDAVLIRESDGIIFAGNMIFDANQGLAFSNTSNVTVVGNDITAIQGDGIRIGGVQDMLVQANWIHDMYGSTQSFNHSDMIQFWGTGIQMNTERVTIADNVLDVGNGPSYQMIFGHNEEYETNGWLFDEIVVENNVIVGGTYHQISINDTQNSTVQYNTVITDPNGFSLLSDGSKVPTGVGWIKLSGDNATIENNIAAQVIDGGQNAISTLGNGQTSSDQSANFVNSEARGDGDLRDLVLRSDSDWNGVSGSDLLWTDGTSSELLAVSDIQVSVHDKSQVTLSADQSRDITGYVAEGDATFEWQFDDGSVSTGMSVAHDFLTSGRHEYTLRITHTDGRTDEIHRSVEIEPATLFDFVIANGAMVNIIDPDMELGGNVVITDEGLDIADGQAPNISYDEPGLASLNAFNFEMTIDAEQNASGVFFYLHQAIRAEVTASGAVQYAFTTDDGDFVAITQDGLFDSSPRHLNFSYSAHTETFTIYVDGIAATSIDVTGTTIPIGSWPLTFGRPWGGTLDGVLSNIRLSQEAGTAEEIQSHYEAITFQAEPEEPVEPEPADPTPVDPEPVDPEPIEPGPVEPEPVLPDLEDPTPPDSGSKGPFEFITSFLSNLIGKCFGFLGGLFSGGSSDSDGSGTIIESLLGTNDADIETMELASVDDTLAFAGLQDEFDVFDFLPAAREQDFGFDAISSGLIYDLLDANTDFADLEQMQIADHHVPGADAFVFHSDDAWSQPY